jgi:N-acetylglucosaminyldiphosphoundecaprenol N-acetyl-beta-D-mannosaminyltransferase
MSLLSNDPVKPVSDSPSANARPYKVSYIMNIPVASLSYQQVLRYLEANIQKKSKCFCVTLNLDILRMAYENKNMHHVIKNADFVFADGMPIIWLSKLNTPHTENTATLPERVPGCDIVQDLCRLSHEKGYKIFILGAGPGVADAAKTKLEQDLPNVNIVSTYSPSSAELQNEHSSDSIVERINQSGADILFVALGAPKQETWVHQNREKLAPYVVIPCGGSIDFIAGVQKKSPKWIGKLGFEWMFRMLYNPQRLFKRYILQDLPFLIKACYREQFSVATS